METAADRTSSDSCALRAHTTCMNEYQTTDERKFETGSVCGQMEQDLSGQQPWEQWLRWLKWLRLIGITLAVYAAMEYVLPVVFPFCVGFLLAWLLYPLRRWFERRLHVQRGMAAYLAFFGGLLFAAALLCAVGAGLFLCGAYVRSQASAHTLVVQGRSMWNVCCEKLHLWTGHWIMEPEDYREIVQALERRRLHIDPVQLLNNWQDVSAQTVQLLAVGLVAVVSTLLMLGGFEELKKGLRRAMRGLFHDGFGQKIRVIGRTYIRAQLLILATVTAICTVGLFVARVPHFWLIGAVIGICDALPFLGTGICFLPWALWRFLTGRYVSGVWFVALYLVTSFARQALEPRLIGQKLGVPPLAILFSIYVGLKVFSRCGFLLGPLSACLIWQLCSSSERKQ